MLEKLLVQNTVSAEIMQARNDCPSQLTLLTYPIPRRTILHEAEMSAPQPILRYPIPIPKRKFHYIRPLLLYWMLPLADLRSDSVPGGYRR